ncbi:MAG TPA: ABC transporter ATP-binding protein [Thermaerobacter sp.]
MQILRAFASGGRRGRGERVPPAAPAPVLAAPARTAHREDQPTIEAAASTGIVAGAESGAPVLVVTDLVKRYGEKVAVDHVSFEVTPGETFGLLGPNGAGKTTTLAIIAGVLRPDGGDVCVGGYSLRTARAQAQRLLGVVPQEVALYPDLTALQNMRYFATLRGLRGRERDVQIEEALELVGLREHARERVDRFSGGMKRRLNIAVGLLGRPRLLLLDEPTVGIDPQSRRHILDAVKGLAAAGMTVLYTSHYMEEVEYLCRRVAIMDHGRVIAQGSLEDVRRLAGESVVLRLRVSGLATPPDWSRLAREAGCPLEMADGELRIVLPDGPRQAPDILNLLAAHGVPLDGLRLEAPDLETVFLSLTGRGLRDGEV